jgi:hypothetical protein
MIVGVLTIDAAVFEAHSLKDKRRVIQSVKQKLRRRFNVSVAEVEYNDLPQRCRLGVAVVSNDARAVHSQLDQVVDVFRSSAGLTLLHYERRLV